MYKPMMSSAEYVENYKPGGLHPVHLGDVFKQRYRVCRKLGFGSWSTVWLARDLSENRYVSLKIGKAASKDYELHEINTLRSIAKADSSHPGFKHIQKLLDAFEHEGPNGLHTCLVFEPLGRSFELLTTDQPEGHGPTQSLTPNAMREASRQLVLAVDFLHSQGLMHRDIQPGNVLLALDYDIDALSEAEINADINLDIPSADDEDEDEDDDDNYDPTFIEPALQLVARKDNHPLPPTSPSYLVEPTPLPSRISFHNPFHIVLIDLGAACPADLPNDARQTYPLGLRSPQVILHLPIDDKADIWALGLTVYQLVTRRTLFSVTVYEDEELTDDSHLESMIMRLGPLPEGLRGVWKRAGKWVDVEGRLKSGFGEGREGYDYGGLKVISIDLQKCMIDLGEVESPNPDNAAEFGQWARSADGLFLLYDIASSPSFCWIQVLFELVRRFRESTFDDPVAFYNTIHTDMPSLPVSDLGHALPTVLVGVRTIPHGARQVFTTEAQELAKENGWGFVEVSAMDVNTIDEALLGIVQAIRVQKQSVGQLENFEGFEQQDLESDQVTVNNVEQEKQAIGKSVLTGLSQRTRTCVIL
ncbi:hypothetical protein MMC18_001173 [Xylographa bjoerkii]|nr:hypothetical protein [Xylographa bjoerkii]